MRALRILACMTLTLALGCAAVSAQGSSGYSVQPILPENQMDTGVSYFDLKVVPGQSQILQVLIKNKEAEPIEVAMEANTAFSNSNGLIEYSYSEERDESLQVDFSKVVIPVTPVIKVPANGKVIAEFVLAVPDEPFEGDVLGGFLFMKLEQIANQEDAGVAIQNIFQYAIGVRLRESEEAVEPLFELAGVEESEIRKQTLLIHLRNPQPLIARNMELVVSVYPQDGHEPLRVFERERIAMAPNSTMVYRIVLGNEQALESGEYRVTVQLRFQEDIWDFEMPLIVQ